MRPLSVRSAWGRRGSRAPEVDAVGCLEQPVEGEPLGSAAETGRRRLHCAGRSRSGAGRRCAAPARSGSHRRRDRAAASAWSPRPPWTCEPITIASSAARSGLGPWPSSSPVRRSRISHSDGLPGGGSKIAGEKRAWLRTEKLREGHVVVEVLERGGPGQDHVCVTGGLVQIDVDRDHEVEVRERTLEAISVGGGEGGVARDGEQCAHLPLARRLHLLGETRGRELAQHLEGAAHPGAVSVEPDSAAGARAVGRRHERGAEWEHHAAGSIEIPGQVVEHVYEPARGRAELRGGRADAPVDGGTAGVPRARVPAGGWSAPPRRRPGPHAPA